MTLALPGRFLWDFWTVEHAGLTFLYALSAPHDPDPHSRHARSRVEVFSSADLRRWDHHGVALAPGEAGAWDDLAIWTGSVASDPGGGWVMLYTGRSRADGGRVQRIGLARSTDLLAWERHPEPVIEADPALYRTRGRHGSTNWRDPWLERTGPGWTAWITAQHRDGPVEGSGTVARATSGDLVAWEVHPPVVGERLSEHLEVPQIVQGGQAMLLNTYAHHVDPKGPLPRACLSLLLRREGEAFAFERVVERWPADARYVIKEIRPGVGLCWLGEQDDGAFVGAVSDPFPLDLRIEPRPRSRGGRREGAGRPPGA